MTDHNIVAASPTPLVERPPQALAVNAAHENADLFTQDQICVSRHFILKEFLSQRDKNESQGVAPQDTHDVQLDTQTCVHKQEKS